MKNVLIAALILVSTFSCKPERDLASYDLIIQNVKLFDGDSIFENATVFVDSNRIKEIIKNKPTEYAGSNIVEGKGHTLTPGLINAHVHAFKEEHLKEAVQSGVLTLLDLFSTQPKVSDTLRNLGNTSKDHAYYYSAGPTVTVAGGHGSQFGPVPLVETAADVPQFIDDRLAEGSDYIKLIIERGGVDFTAPTLSDAMIKEAIAHCRKKEVVSVAHITRRPDALKAAGYGISGFAHIWSRDSTEISNSEIKSLKESGAFMTPTLFVWQRFYEESKRRKVDMELLKKDLFKLYKAGILILAGTDPPNHRINYGSDLFKELELFVTVGISELDALKSATSNVAKAFGLQDKGYIKEGNPADLILIKGDPIKDIKNLSNISRIWKGGTEVVLDVHTD